MTRGWSVNLTLPGVEHTFMAELPTAPLYTLRHGPVIELVFWSERTEAWVHAVRDYFERELPRGHVQVTFGDMAWIHTMVARYGEPGFRMAVHDLIETMTPEDN